MTPAPETGRRPHYREYAVGVLALLVVGVLAWLVIKNWHDVRQVTSYGLLGGLVLGVLGGATVPMPIAVTAVYFALGGVLKPWFGPEALAPMFIGLVCGLGEACGGLSTYATGYAGGASLAGRPDSGKPGRLGSLYACLAEKMEAHGGWVLFGVSAIINPFFYPVSLTAGLTRFGAVRYFFTCFAGKVVKCTGIAYAGYFGLRGLFQALGINV